MPGKFKLFLFFICSAACLNTAVSAEAFDFDSDGSKACNFLENHASLALPAGLSEVAGVNTYKIKDFNDCNTVREVDDLVVVNISKRCASSVECHRGNLIVMKKDTKDSFEVIQNNPVVGMTNDESSWTQKQCHGVKLQQCRYFEMTLVGEDAERKPVVYFLKKYRVGHNAIEGF